MTAAEPDAESESEPAVEGADGETPVAPRKRTRRGTRGGRGRKRKTPASTAAESGDEGAAVDSAVPEPEPEVEEPAVPVIHLPDRALGANGDESAAEDSAPAPRTPTRRGTRGGRGRKPKPAVVAAAGEDGGAAEAAPPGDEGDWQYTPMSEWGDV